MTQYRKDSLQNGECYHIYTRSIAKFVIFNDEHEYHRMFRLLDLYRSVNFKYKMSQFLNLSAQTQAEVLTNLVNDDCLVKIIAFCLMPTHIHLILKQVQNDGISKYLSRVLNGYSRYFNTKHARNGPLWSGRFKNVRVADDEQLLHLTRYIHLNPTSAGLVPKPENWVYSSYPEYAEPEKIINFLCNFQDLVSVPPQEYKNFVNDRKDYQRQLSLIKTLTIENYSG